MAELSEERKKQLLNELDTDSFYGKGVNVKMRICAIHNDDPGAPNDPDATSRTYEVIAWTPHQVTKDAEFRQSGCVRMEDAVAIAVRGIQSGELMFACIRLNTEYRGGTSRSTPLLDIIKA